MDLNAGAVCSKARKPLRFYYAAVSSHCVCYAYKEVKCAMEVIYTMFFSLPDMESRDLLSDTIVHLHGGTAT